MKLLGLSTVDMKKEQLLKWKRGRGCSGAAGASGEWICLDRMVQSAVAALDWQQSTCLAGASECYP